MNTQQNNNFPKLSQPAQRALARAGIQHLKQLSGYSEVEIPPVAWHWD